ncbi:MAG: hypothetical protein J6B30_00915 [Muribaculaceae bacterium]|nr:hypothetical protein [Muribaculaceae bacterium]MBR3830491.1 hypothetical protein [Muribaculaceae bacterium]
MENKQTILSHLADLDVSNIVAHIKNGTISLAEVTTILGAIGLTDKLSLVQAQAAGAEEQDWQMACAHDNLDTYHQYISKYPNSPHVAEAQQRLSYLEGTFWESIQQNLNQENITKYLRIFPQGKHSKACYDYLDDLPWMQAVQQNTIAAYNDYAKTFPGKHEKEIKEAIDNLTDDIDWEDATRIATDDAISRYLERHPDGRHAEQASTAIEEREKVNQLLNDLRNDRNSYSALDLQRRVQNMQLQYSDLYQVFDPDQVESLRNFISPADLPKCPPPDFLLGDTTEVFFWGTPASGKTCALGALLSAANRYGILKREDGASGFYRDLLCNIFVNDGICVLPYGSPDDSVAEMGLSLRDSQDKYHRLTFVDLAGEVFRSMYRRLNGIVEESFERGKTLEKILEYLNDTRNPKIHYFIVPFGEVNNMWPDDHLKMADYLNATMQYLTEQQIIRKGTNGVYILVSKSDKMPCAPHERKEMATRYITETLPAFYNNLRVICDKAGVADFDIIPFTLGDVFAQNLCRFDRNNTDEMLNTLIAKGEVKATSWWDKLMKTLRN